MERMGDVEEGFVKCLKITGPSCFIIHSRLSCRIQLFF